MTATWLLVLLFVAFVIARLNRSTKLWWVFLTAIMSGLLMGLISAESIRSDKTENNDTAMLIEVVDNYANSCTQSLVADVTEYATISQSGVAVNIEFVATLPTTFVDKYRTNSRDRPRFFNDS